MVKSSLSACAYSMRRVLLIIFFLWIFLFAYLCYNVFTVHEQEEALKSTRKSLLTVRDQVKLANDYERTLNELEKLREAYDDLKEKLREEKTKRILAEKRKIKTIKNYTDKLSDNRITNHGYSLDHEISRRALDNSIKEIYYYISDQFSQLKNASFIEHATEQLLSLMGQSSAFAEVDSANEWRYNFLLNILSSLRAQFEILQNPKDCSKAKILTCNLNKACGFGCQLHHVTYCFIVAYGTNRTLLLKQDGSVWSYIAEGWSFAFLPVSSCSYYSALQSDSEVPWSFESLKTGHRVLSLPLIDTLVDKPDYLPPAIPSSIASELIKLHSNPPVFFIASFMRYLMRPTSYLHEKIENAASKIPFDKGPIVGLQIRRTDKLGNEADFHSLAEYMKWTENWFKIEEYKTGKSVKRRIYVATDDPTIFEEAQKSYPEYEVYGEAKIAKTAQVNSRYSKESLIGVIINIELLARCSYLVCTFSSQVCRVGYELMQINLGDAGDKFHSLDDIYYYGGQLGHEQIAVEAYKAKNKNEMDLEVGDIIGVAGNHWNGYSKGTNQRSNKIGLYPSYKVREKYIIVDFP